MCVRYPKLCFSERRKLIALVSPGHRGSSLFPESTSEVMGEEMYVIQQLGFWK